MFRMRNKFNPKGTARFVRILFTRVAHAKGNADCKRSF